jgi:hypothetical protein
MSTKQAQKKAKRAAASKQKKKVANKERNFTQFLLGRRQEARDAASPEGVQAAEARLRYDIATKGVIQTALDLKQNKQETTESLTNVIVLQGINEMIPILGNIHGVIEVVEKLVGMKKIVLSEPQQAVIDAFDRQIVSVAEDVNAIFVFINKEQQVEEYIDLYVHYTNTLAEIMQFDIPAVMEETLRPNELVINEYVTEHKHEAETNYDFGMRLHGERIARVASLYRTVQPSGDVIPEGAKPLEGELVDEDAYEDIGAKEIN